MPGCERIRLHKVLVGSGIAPGSGCSRIGTSGSLLKRRLNGESRHNYHWQPRSYNIQPRPHDQRSIHRQPWANHQQPGRIEDHDRIRERRKQDDRWRDRRAFWRRWIRRRRQRS